MPNVIISANVEEALKSHAVSLSERESRTVSHYVGSALRLYLALPPQIRNSLTEIDNLGSDEEKRWMAREISRIINQTAFEMNGRIAAEGMGGVWVEDEQRAQETAAIE
jgi:hypothetical protein